jgi:SusD family.
MKTTNILSIFLLSLTLFSCDLLDETAYNKVTVGNFYTTREGVTSGVNGLYSTLRDLYINEYFIYLCEGPTDIWSSFYGPEQFKNWTIDATNGEVNTLWNNCYRAINQCNSVLYALEHNTIPGLDNDLRDRYIAESKYIRAHYFYHLVQQFGDVPMSLEPVTSAVTTAIKTPQAQVWEQIINDLEDAVEVLPEEYPNSDYGRVTNYAAKHHLSRVLLTIKRDNSDLQRALTLAEEIINSGKYSLVSNHKDLWDLTKKHNTEVLFPVLYSQNSELNGNGNTSHMYFTSAYSEEHPGVLRVIEYGRPWSRLRSTFYAMDLIDETKDKRFEDCFISSWNITENSVKEELFSPYTKKMEQKTWTKGELAMIAPKKAWSKEQVKDAWPVLVFLPDSMRNYINPAEDVQSVTYPNAEWPSNTRFMSEKMYPYIVKCLDPLRPEVNWMPGSRDVFVFRLGETYLLAAEAALLLEDKTKSVKYINEIRQRAAIPGKESEMKVAEQDVTIDFILDERARELLGEMHRWYDLKRTGKLQERMNNPKMNPSVAGKFKDFHVLRPIPRNQLLNVTNPSEFTQNPGYAN